MQHGWLLRAATEQRARVQADAFDATLVQQAIEHALGIALGEELGVAHLDRQWPVAPLLDERGQLGQPRRAEGRCV